MINPYETSLKYLMEEMLLFSFDFKVIKEKIQDIINHSTEVPYELEFLLTAIPPTTESNLIKLFYRSGKLKSYQRNEICIKIYNTIKSALNSNIDSSLKRFATFKHRVEVNVKHNITDFKVNVRIRDCKRIGVDSIYAILNHFNVGPLGFCDSVKILLSTAKAKNGKKETVFNATLRRLSSAKLHRFMTLKQKHLVKEFYNLPEVMEILFKNIFIEGSDSDKRTELTFDVLKMNTRPQKRRKIRLNSGEYENLHDYFTPYTSHEEFVEIIETNNILGFYPSVRAVKSQDIVTVLIDIDVSNFLKNSFSMKILWELIVILIEELINNLTNFLNLPYPLIVFSGSRGVHLLYKITPNTVNDDYGYINYSELYLLPNQNALIRNKKSLLRNKFTFFRRIMQAILLYTVHHLTLDKIPEKIRSQLGITKVRDLFTLSTFSNNKIGILLDTSVNNASVHRVFSIHPSSRFVSIPLNDPRTGFFSEKFKDYEELKQASAIKTVIENIKSGKKALYYQFPPEISKVHIKHILQPNKILPVLSTIVRFGDRWVTERSEWSYKYWLELYELNNLYDYISATLISVNRTDKNIHSVYFKLVKIIKTSSIRTKYYIKEIVNDYFFRKLSFRSLKIRLDAFHDLEFYYRFKWEELNTITSKRFEYLLKEDREQQLFFKKFTSFFNISQVLMSYFLGVEKQAGNKLKLSIHKFYARVAILHKLTFSLQTRENNEQIILNLIKIACLFNCFTRFFKELFRYRILY